MLSNFAKYFLLCIVIAFVFPSILSAQEGGTGTIILDTASFWRVHYTIKPPVVKKEQEIEKITFPAKWIMRSTPSPSADWAKPDFDDSGWARFPGVSPDKVSFLALVCMRGKFKVTDPTKVKDLTLLATYRGGIVVYLNGKEIARGHLPKGGGLGQLAEDYKDGEAHDRSLSDVKIPDGALRKGVNILSTAPMRALFF